MEQWQLAEDMYKEVIELRQQLLGSKHSHTLDSKMNLAALLKAKGSVEQSVSFSPAVSFVPNVSSCFGVR